MAKKRGSGMTHKQLLSRLSDVHQQTEKGTIFVPAQPIPLDTPLDIAAATQMGMETILFCVWSSEEGAWRFGRLNLVPLSDRSVAVVWEGADTGVHIVARLAPGASRQLWGTFLHDFLSAEQEEYGLSPLPSLPDRMTNYRPDLLGEESVRAALHAYLEQQPADPADRLDLFFKDGYEEESDR